MYLKGKGMMNISKKNILKYADNYDKNYKGTDEKEMKEKLEEQRYLTRKDLIKIGCWKSKRPKRHYEDKENDDSTVREITKFSFKTKSEKARIKSLLALKGVSWPVASAILHFAFPSKYPMWDFRVLWSLGWTAHYNLNLWQEYCSRIRKLSKKYKVPIRTVEKALWKYSKEHQNRIRPR